MPRCSNCRRQVIANSMTGTNHRDLLAEMSEPAGPAPETPAGDIALADAGRNWAHRLAWLPATKESSHFAQRWASLAKTLDRILSEVDFQLGPDEQLPEDLQWMHDNVRLVRGTQSEVHGGVPSLRRVPHVRTPDQAVMPRVLAIAQDLLHTVSYRYSDHAFTTYITSFQTVTGLNMSEL